MELDQQIIRRLFNYDPGTGIFTYAEKTSSQSRVIIGSAAGCSNGHTLQVRIYGRSYLLSRLAFLYMNGLWPSGLVDHKDRNPMNNSWKNLRDATYSQNNKNRPTAKNKTSRHRGVSKSRGKWAVVVRVDGKLKWFGYYDDEDEAGRIAAPYFEGVAP